MARTGETNLQGLKHPSKYKAIPNNREELMVNAQRIITPFMEKMLNKAWEYDTKGNSKLANKYYKAGNILPLLASYAEIINNYIDLQSSLNSICTSTDVNEKYSVSKLQECLLCLGKEYSIDLLDIWNQLLSLYSIEILEECDECCVGIGAMIIEGDDDCTAFIIGDCDENDAPVPPFGEFAVCEFPIEEVTEPEGENLYDNCN